MKNFCFTILPWLLTTLCLAACGERNVDIGTYTLFKNGTFFIKQGATATNLIVKNGKVTGYNADETPYLKLDAGVVDMGGAFAYPGFHDSHDHMMETGMGYGGITFTSADNTSDAIAAKVAAHAAKTPAGQLIVGSGFHLSDYDAWSLSDLAKMDAASANHQMILLNNSGHNAIVNTLVMQASNITSTTTVPFGGTIVGQPGEPTGMLRESAMQLAYNTVEPEVTDEAILATLEALLGPYWAKWGYTEINDMMGLPAGRFMRPQLYKQQESQGRLPVRVNYSYTIFNLNDIEGALQYVGTDTDMVSFIGCKIFIDGTFGGGQAWTTWPHQNGTYGNYYVWTDDTKGEQYNINRIVERADDLGLNMHYHVQGDVAIGVVLDALDAVVARKGKLNSVHTLIHLAFVTGDQITRIKKFGSSVVATMQPALWYEDQSAVSYYGVERMKQSLPVMDVINGGVSTGISTDFSVSPISLSPPLAIMAVGLDPTAYQPPTRTAMTMQALIDGFTIGSAATVSRKDIGTLEPGKVADMVVFDQNLLTVDPKKLSTVKVLGTYINGKLVHVN